MDINVWVIIIGIVIFLELYRENSIRERDELNKILGKNDNN